LPVFDLGDAMLDGLPWSSASGFNIVAILLEQQWMFTRFDDLPRVGML